MLLQILVTHSLLFTGLLAQTSQVAAKQSLANPSAQSMPAALDVLPAVEETVIPAHWRFQIGDDPHFADPKVNDDSWSAFQPGKPDLPLPRSTFQIVWYRTHVRVPAASRDLALSLLHFHTAEQLFVNGTLVDTWGKHGPGWGRFVDSRRTCLIPDSALRNGDLTIAIRAAAGAPSRHPLSSDTVLILGPASVLKTEKSLLSFRYFTSNGVQIGVEAFVLLLALSLALAMREEREYISLVLLVTAYLAADAFYTAGNVADWQSNPAFVLLSSTDPLISLLLLELVRAMLRGRLTTLLRVLYWFTGATCLAWCLAGVFAMYGDPAPPMLSAALGNAFELVRDLPILGLAIFTLWFAIGRRSREAFLLSIPLLVEGGFSFTGLLSMLNFAPDLRRATIPITTFSVKWFEVSRIFLCLTLLIVLALRTMRIARERGITAGELHAARTVQQLLLDSTALPTPGFLVETAYIPASEVGGDFYYVSPGVDGSLLVIFGDVSGKGLRAAMTVSAILGALRNESSRTPSAVLRNLNLTLYGHIEGFATCCAALLGTGGSLTLANAGNPAPYLDGRELEAEPGLPLGLLPEAHYEELTEVMPPGSRLLFASDGVIEATHPKSGQLFGFERTAALAHESAGAVAKAAQLFGQTDDITVLAIDHLAVA